jgi:hypothetical protein
MVWLVTVMWWINDQKARLDETSLNLYLVSRLIWVE